VGETPLLLAVVGRRERLVAVLLDAGADKECVNKNKQTPLLVAAEMQYMEDTVTLLLQRGANKDAKDRVRCARVRACVCACVCVRSADVACDRRTAARRCTWRRRPAARRR
jgi:hypothetical protein